MAHRLDGMARRAEEIGLNRGARSGVPILASNRAPSWSSPVRRASISDVWPTAPRGPAPSAKASQELIYGEWRRNLGAISFGLVNDKTVAPFERNSFHAPS